MTYEKLLEAFIDEMQNQGKLTYDDLSDFLAKFDSDFKNYRKAKGLVDEIFKGAGIS